MVPDIHAGAGNRDFSRVLFRIINEILGRIKRAVFGGYSGLIEGGTAGHKELNFLINNGKEASNSRTHEVFPCKTLL